MQEEKHKTRRWLGIVPKTLTSIIAGLLIAWAGFVGDLTLSSVSSKQESARLITELQIRREEAETELRKDVFDQALEAFLLKSSNYDGSLKDMSKQLLRLELLALNFGDSLSLSPLFIELRTDLERARPVNEAERRDYKERKGQLMKRLEALAKRVASAQVSSLAQHGETKKINIPLDEYKELEKMQRDPCHVLLLEERDYAWPDFEVLAMMGAPRSTDRTAESGRILKEMRHSDIYKEAISTSGTLELNNIPRNLRLHVSDVDHCRKTAKVQIIVAKAGQGDPEVDRSFTLDYFNFPMVDNTRLSGNHRLAVVMEEFHTRGELPHIELTGIVFPAQYASLKDRPGMQEARKLLESALRDGGIDE